jgi:hypothetical protein
MLSGYYVDLCLDLTKLCDCLVFSRANFSERSNGYTHAIVAQLPSGSFKLTSADFDIHSFANMIVLTLVVGRNPFSP